MCDGHRHDVRGCFCVAKARSSPSSGALGVGTWFVSNLSTEDIATVSRVDHYTIGPLSAYALRERYLVAQIRVNQFPSLLTETHSQSHMHRTCWFLLMVQRGGGTYQHWSWTLHVAMLVLRLLLVARPFESSETFQLAMYNSITREFSSHSMRGPPYRTNFPHMNVSTSNTLRSTDD